MLAAQQDTDGSPPKQDTDCSPPKHGTGGRTPPRSTGALQHGAACLTSPPRGLVGNTTLPHLLCTGGLPRRLSRTRTRLLSCRTVRVLVAKNSLATSSTRSGDTSVRSSMSSLQAGSECKESENTTRLGQQYHARLAGHKLRCTKDGLLWVQCLPCTEEHHQLE